MAGDKLLSIKADTAQDFLDNSHKAMRDSSKLGETKAIVAWAASFDLKTKKVKKGTLTLKTSITRVHWAGAAKKKPDKSNLDAIKEIESLNKAHEEAHRTSYEKAFKKAKAKLEEEMVGKTQQEVKDIVDKMGGELKEACEDLHKSGGLIDVNDNGSGTISVTEKAEGPGGCK